MLKKLHNIFLGSLLLTLVCLVADLNILFDNIIGTKILALFWHKSQKLYWYWYCLNFQILKLQFCYSFAIVGLKNLKYWVVQSLLLVLCWYCKFAFFHLSKLKLINFLMNYGKYSKKDYFLLFRWQFFENITYLLALFASLYLIYFIIYVRMTEKYCCCLVLGLDEYNFGWYCFLGLM